MKNELAAIRADINAALEAVAAKHGLKTLTAGKCTYGDSNFTFSVTGVKEGGLTKEQQFYKNVEELFKLPPLGTPVILNRKQFITDGINTTGSKVHMKETATGKTYLFVTEAVAKRWAEQQPK